uniref:Metalloendopeptidase n=1 Tax=Romanomermis culicivorax TaxID=13658 RepID=A0A915I3D4_ROMCU
STRESTLTTASDKLGGGSLALALPNTDLPTCRDERKVLWCKVVEDLALPSPNCIPEPIRSGSNSPEMSDDDLVYKIKCDEYVYLQPEDEILAQKYMQEGVTDLRQESDRQRNIFDSDAFEGDMLYFDESNVNGIKKLMKAKFVSAGRYAENKWPKGIIPYKIASNLNPKLRTLFSMAIKIFHDVTCVKFIPSSQYKAESHRNILPFILKPSPEGLCLTTIGLNDSRPENIMQMGPGCAELSIVLHELLHCLGFVHETMVSSRANHKITDNKRLSKWDIMKVNKHYGCGMESKKCKDKLPTSQCRRFGLGRLSDTNWNPDTAKCSNEYWALKYCAFTCGYCYKFVKVSKRHRIKRSIIGPMTLRDSCIESRESLYDKSDAAHCMLWRNDGLCQTSSSFMQENCAKTCKQC